MSAQEEKTVSAQNPSEFFETIGSKVEGLASATNGDKPNTDEDDDSGRPPVDEIESLCMNCGENVSIGLRIFLSFCSIANIPRA